MIDDQSLLIEAKDWLRSRVGKGAKCPCCTQFAKVYSRRLYSSIAAALIYFYKNFDHSEFVHRTVLLKHPRFWGGGSGDFAKLTYWGLIEEKIEEGKDKRTSGYWRITEKGIAFVENKTTIQSHVKIYDGKVLGFEGKEVNISECLGKKFSYSELMGR